jgi:dTDP-4-dehydrorhamnose reductase
MVVLVTGASGQVGQSLKHIAYRYPKTTFIFCNSVQLDITSKLKVEELFDNVKPNYCINTAAYTAVDKSEIEATKAQLVNVNGSKNLAEICKKHNTILLHLSTDFIFDGLSKKPYTEESTTNPLGVYGKTKLEGEKEIRIIWHKHFIIRTSWVYSQFGTNFMKKILSLDTQRKDVSVVLDQIGTPTNAADLAQVLLQIIDSKKENFGVYNFSNEGQCSWFDFAKKIVEVFKIGLIVNPILTEDFPTLATRPKYSVLDKTKIKSTFNIPILSWEESLETYNV